MRILIATQHTNIIGGVETYLDQVVPALQRNQHHLAFLAEHGPTGERRLGKHWGDIAVIPPGLGQAATIAAVTEFRPDIVFQHGLTDAGLERALQRACPAVYFAHNYRGICPAGPKRFQIPRHEPCRRSIGPACLALHYPRRCGGLNPITTVLNYKEQLTAHTNLNKYSAVVVAGEHMQREVTNAGIPPGRVHIVRLFPTGPTTTGTLDGRVPRGEVAFVGRLVKEKGAHLLIEAMHIITSGPQRPTSPHLHIVGVGEEGPHLYKQAGRLDVRATFHGWLDTAAKQAILSETDVLALPSVWPEPFGLSALEAAALGKPVVAFSYGGPSDWIASGVNGELAGTRPTARGLADAMARALSDPVHYQRLCDGALESARRLTMANHITRLEEVFEAVLGGSS